MNEARHGGTLAGATVIVTRPPEQAGPLCRAVEEAGGRAVRFPALEIHPPRSPSMARNRLARLRPGDWLVFVSRNAVTSGLALLPEGRLPRGVRIAAVGPATAGTLRARTGIEPVVPERHDSEGLLAHPGLRELDGRRVVIAKAPGGRRLLARELRRRGAEVTGALVYRRARPAVAPGALGRLLPRDGAVVTTVTSGEVLDNLVHIVDAATLARLRRNPLVAAGERVAGLARWAGFEDVTAAAGPDPESLVHAVAGRLSPDAGRHP